MSSDEGGERKNNSITAHNCPLESRTGRAITADSSHPGHKKGHGHNEESQPTKRKKKSKKRDKPKTTERKQIIE